ncbi:MAG: hypothetical protein AAFX87_16925 [Bacteroidota bacterium]
MFYFFIESILFGFGFYSIILGFVLITKRSHNSQLLNKIDLAACTAVIIVSWIWLIDFGTDLYHSYLNADNDRFGGLLGRMFGSYWYGFWIYPITYLGLPQLLWIKKIRANLISRFCIGIGMLFASSFEQFVIIITSLHRDYLPSSWGSFSGSFVLDYFIYCLIFMVVVYLIYAIKKSLAK